MQYSPPTVTFDEVYKTWRNRARKFSAKSIIDMALWELSQPAKNKKEDIERAPWQTLLIVKWVNQDRAMDRAGSPAITVQQFDDLRQRLWELPEQLGAQLRDTLPGKLFFGQLINPQFGFQRRLTGGFVREAAILSAQPNNNPLRRMFEEKACISLSNFVDLAFAAYSGIIEGRQVLDSAWFEPLLKAYPGEVLNAFADTVSVDHYGLRQFCRGLPDADRRLRSELFEFPVLTRYPFLKVDRQLHCWHPMVFFRGMEAFVHSVLSEAGSAYIEPFSRLFEQHVVSEAKRFPARFHTEDEIRSWLTHGAKVPDGLLSYPDCNVFVESKAKLFDESIMCVGHTERFAHMTKALRLAIQQAWSASALTREEKRAPEQVLRASRDYLLIVTNREVNASNGASLAEMYPSNALTPIFPRATLYLPLERIYVLSIEDFEWLVGGLNMLGLALPEFLDDCVAADSKSESSVFFFEQHLARRKVPRSHSALVESAIEESARRLERAVQ